MLAAVLLAMPQRLLAASAVSMSLMTIAIIPARAGTVTVAGPNGADDGVAGEVDGFAYEFSRDAPVAPPLGKVEAVPEPPGWALLLIGLAGLGWVGLPRRRGRPGLVD